MAEEPGLQRENGERKRRKAEREERRRAQDSGRRKRERKKRRKGRLPFGVFQRVNYLQDSSTATAQATVAPTIGLLPMPIRPIISTCAGTEEEPANWASECILPMVSVMP